MTRCKYGIAKIPSVYNAVRHGENERKKSFLNYESLALTAELQALLKRTALGLAIRLILDEYLANRPCFDAFLCVTIRKH